MTGTGAILEQVSHRPWPLPYDPWIIFQSWRELLAAHWPVRWDALRPLVPAELVLEAFDGHAWVGLTPFRLTELRPRGLPAIPALSDFPEMNLRTYVRVGERPGIYFFSLDAASCLAVVGARTFYRLPYFHAEMTVESHAGWVHYQSRRSGGVDAEFVGRYRPVGPVFQASPGTLEHFLLERYALYVVLRGGKILRGDIHHRPWPLQQAEAEIERNTVASAHGITLPPQPPLLHFAARQDTLVWAPKLVTC
jgi:uncharacterized protein YqjF (DUF2071 family)